MEGDGGIMKKRQLVYGVSILNHSGPFHIGDIQPLQAFVQAKSYLSLALIFELPLLLLKH